MQKWWSKTGLAETPCIWWCLFFQMEWLHRWASRCRLPFVDAKTVQKQHFKKGILKKNNFPTILMEFYCLCLARLNLPPAPGSAGQQAYHTNLGTWGQVFNPRGSRRHWPREHVDLFGFLRALFSGPSLSTLAFFSTACPFPSPWVRGSQRQDQKERAPTRLHHLPELDVIIQTVESRLHEWCDVKAGQIPADQNGQDDPGFRPGERFHEREKVSFEHDCWAEGF